MAVLNRDLAPSQQIQMIRANLGLTATGATAIIAQIEAPGEIIAGQVWANGLSGAPVWSFGLLRALSGGLTLIGLGATVSPAGATINGVSFSLGQTTSAYAQTNDLLVMTTGGSNTAALSGAVTVALKMTQDVKTFFGVAI